MTPELLREMIRSQVALLERAEQPAAKQPAAKKRTPTPGVWHSWSPRNPYKYMESENHPGEERAAWEMGGDVQGDATTYDIVDAAGRIWEVKQPNRRGIIRAGSEGTKALVPFMRTIHAVCDQLTEGFDRIDFDALGQWVDGAELTVTQVESFLRKDVPDLKRGTISPGRIYGGTHKNPYGLLQVLEFVRSLIGDADKRPSRQVSWRGATHELNIARYVHVSREIGLSDSEIDADVAELFAGTFSHPAFSRPRAFIRELMTNAIHASDVFGHTAGVIMVQPDKFMIVVRDRLDEYFSFFDMTQARPEFLFTPEP